MKKLMVAIVAILFSCIILGQQVTTIPPLSKQDYFAKSKKQKTTGVVLLTSGSILSTVGLAITLSNLSGLFDPNEPARHNSATADILGYSGLVIAAGSIPFFIASSRNRRKAVTLSFNNFSIPGLTRQGIINQPIPVITFSTYL